jgi:TonB-linked SusC/RagA family outer membrane protein
MNALYHTKRWLFLAILLVAALPIWAQQHTISGIVWDKETHEALVGATVLEAGRFNGVVTDSEGKFTIKVASPAGSLVVSYVTYQKQGILVDGQTFVEVFMVEEPYIEPVVVVGYGTQRKSDLTGAVGIIKAKDIEQLPVANVEQALQGKIAGVYVSTANGSPGEGAVIRIRGTGTLNNSNPLYVIDGMITNDASAVSPQDVLSIEVLKDASAAAIYGSRGANGVVLITTKKGSGGGEAVFSFSSYRGNQLVTKQIDMANAAEYAQLYNEFRGQNYFINPDSLGEGTNWQNEIFRPATISNYNLSASGGSDKATYNISGNLFDQDGIIKNSSYKRYTLRINNTWKMRQWLTVGNNISYSTSDDIVAPNVVTSAYYIPPVFAPRDTAGEFTDPTFFGLAIANPAGQFEYNKQNLTKRNKLFGNIYAEASFLKYFTYRANVGFDRVDEKVKRYTPIYEVSPSQLNKLDRLDITLKQNRDWIIEHTVRFDRELRKNRFGVLAGYTADQREFEEVVGSRAGFPGDDEDLLFLGAGNDTTQQVTGRADDEAMISYLFRFNYSYNNRYLLTASWRTDQSSRFIAANRTGHFPSIGLGWNLGQEPAIEKLKIFDRLKLRGSYGILGNQNSAKKYPSSGVVQSGLYGVFGTNETLTQGATLTSLANANLRWETVKQTDFGIEMGFFKNRLEIEADWFRRFTYDIIAAVPIPDYVGSVDDPIVNAAEVLNRGWELTANWRQNGNKISWSLGGTYSPIRNEVMKLSQGKSEIFAAFQQGEPASRTVVGLPIGAFYGYKVAGIFQTEEELSAAPKFGGEQLGDIRFEDINGDGVLDTDDRTYLGSPIPTLTYSLNAGLEGYGFDLAANLFGLSGNKVYNAKQTYRFGVYNWEASALDRWTPETPSETEPRITNGGANYRVSDRFIEDGSFVRLRSVSLGYTISDKMRNRLGINRLRVYLLGNNIWTNQKYSGYTPEFSNKDNPLEVGFDRGVYPLAKSWQFGIDASF